MDPLLKDILTVGFSTASLIISMISLWMGISSYRRQGGWIRLSLNYENKAVNGHFLLTVQNQGYHSIKINQIRMITATRNFPVHQESFELEYGKSESVKISLAGYKDVQPVDITQIEVTDVENKIYKISTRSLRQKLRR